MRIVVVAILGSIGGLIVGGTLGLLAGIAWINIFKPSQFEGYASTMVAFVVIPFELSSAVSSAPYGLALLHPAHGFALSVTPLTPT